jgi:thioredoxin-related protein
LVKLYNQYKSKGFEIISVNVQDSPDEVAAFLEKYGAKFVGAINGSPTDVAKLYRVRGTPRNFVINAEGAIVADITGYGQGDRRIDNGLRKAGLEMD